MKIIQLLSDSADLIVGSYQVKTAKLHACENFVCNMPIEKNIYKYSGHLGTRGPCPTSLIGCDATASHDYSECLEGRVVYGDTHRLVTFHSVVDRPKKR